MSEVEANVRWLDKVAPLVSDGRFTPATHDAYRLGEAVERAVA